MAYPAADRALSRWPLLAPLGAVLFTLAWVFLGLVSPGYPLFDMVIEPYSPMSQPISGLGLGVTGPWMNAAFIFCGLMIAIGLFATARTWPTGGKPRLRNIAAGLLTVSGLGISVCGVFTLEQVLPHLIGFLLAIGASGVGCILAGVTLRGCDRWLAAWLLGAGPLTLILLIAFLVTFDPIAAAENQGVAGLTQRALVSTTLLSAALIGYRGWTHPRSASTFEGA